MKKLTVLFLSLALVFSLAACGEADDDALIIGRWGGNDQETAAFNDMLDGFKEMYPDVEVEERIYTDFNTEIQAEIIAGNGPDVFYVDAFMAPFFIEQGLLAELDTEEYAIADFYDNLTGAFKQDGKYYAIPKDYSTLALYYNTDVVDGDDIPADLADVVDATFLDTLTLKDGMDVAMTVNVDLARNMYIAQTDGSSIIDNDRSNMADSGVVANLDFWFEALKAGSVKRPADIGQGWNGDAFGNEKTAIMIEGNWVVGHLNNNFPDLNYEVMEIPTIDGVEGSMLFTVGWGLNAQASNAQAGANFIQYATGFDGMKKWAGGSGVLPSREDVATDLGVATDDVLKHHVAAVEYATYWQAGTNLNTINTEFLNYAPSVFSGDSQRTLAEALQLAEDEANAIIDENN